MGVPKGYKFSEETRRRMRIAHTGKPLSEFHKQRLRESWNNDERRRLTSELSKKNGLRPEQREQMIELGKSNKGKIRTPEMRYRLSEKRKELYRSGKLIHHMKGKHHSESTKMKISISHTGKKCSEEHKRNVGKHTKLMWEDPEYAAEMRAYLKSPDFRNIVSSKQKLNWQNPEYADRQRAITLKALHIRPTRPEQRLLDIINKYNLPHTYTGNGALIINGYNPDFANNNGSKKLIEVYGDYWHNRKNAHENDAKRLAKISALGYSSLVIWENEINNLPEDDLLNKITTFTEECDHGTQ